ncbi:MAG TPA: hypothetical protein VG479_12220 [Gaiellaceae bacterium]|jgi:hypothetical protein|nr:hypothetical protein [Gaiellaceae bacterium]
MPKGRIVFSGGGSPGYDGDKYPEVDWFNDPEGTVATIAAANNARYVEGSLVFAPGGRRGEALFDTNEPAFDDRGFDAGAATMLHQLAIDLDALEARLLVPVTLWRFRGGGVGQSP